MQRAHPINSERGEFKTWVEKLVMTNVHVQREDHDTLTRVVLQILMPNLKPFSLDDLPDVGSSTY